MSEVLGSKPGLATYFRFLPLIKEGQLSVTGEVLVSSVGCLSLPRKSVVRLTDRPDMTLDVYRGRKTTTQQLLMSMRRHHVASTSIQRHFNVLCQLGNFFYGYL